MKRSRQQLMLFTALLAMDQLSKAWVEHEGFRPFTVIEGFFDIVRAHNTGVAFSVFADLPASWRTLFLVLMTCAIALAVVIWWNKERQRPGLTSWLLIGILAGAVGNIWDRIQLGYVVDFILWHVRLGGQTYYWPAFNLADSYISVAVVLLLLISFRQQRDTAHSTGGS